MAFPNDAISSVSQSRHFSILIIAIINNATLPLLNLDTVHHSGVSKRGQFDPFPERRQFGWNGWSGVQSIGISYTFYLAYVRQAQLRAFLGGGRGEQFTDAVARGGRPEQPRNANFVRSSMLSSMWYSPTAILSAPQCCTLASKFSLQNMKCKSKVVYACSPKIPFRELSAPFNTPFNIPFRRPLLRHSIYRLGVREYTGGGRGEQFTDAVAWGG